MDNISTAQTCDFLLLSEFGMGTSHEIYSKHQVRILYISATHHLPIKPVPQEYPHQMKWHHLPLVCCIPKLRRLRHFLYDKTFDLILGPIAASSSLHKIRCIVNHCYHRLSGKSPACEKEQMHALSCSKEQLH